MKQNMKPKKSTINTRLKHEIVAFNPDEVLILQPLLALFTPPLQWTLIKYTPTDYFANYSQGTGARTVPSFERLVTLIKQQSPLIKVPEYHS